MAGRGYIYGIDDQPLNGLRDQESYLSRIVRGQISSTSVNPDANTTNNNKSNTNTAINNGIVAVDTIDVVATRHATVTPIWFSISNNQSSWGRFQPGGGEFVHVAYRNDNTAVIVGYDMTASGDGVGYAELNKMQQQGINGMATWKQLNPLEFDFKSGGDAYIYGSNRGTLLLAGGQAFIKLDKQAYRIDTKAAHMKQTANAATTRFGVVYRNNLPSDIQETPTASGSLLEYLVNLNKITPLGTTSPQSRSLIQFGDVYDFSYPPRPIPGTANGVTPSPLRGLISIGDVTDFVEVSRIELDVAGNVSIVKATTVNFDATASARINASHITIGSATSNQPLVLGTELVSYLTALESGLAAVATALSNPSSPEPNAIAGGAALTALLETLSLPSTLISVKAFTE